MVKRLLASGVVLLAIAGVGSSVGCNGAPAPRWDWWRHRLPAGTGKTLVPYPVNLLLPDEIRIDSFTGARTFDEAGGVRGIDVRVKAIDAFGDVTKAFGTFRFELYRFRPNNADPKGAPVKQWRVDLLDPKANARHWNDIPPGYEFHLTWGRSVPVGSKFVLAAIFSSPFTERKFDERVFLSGH